MSADISCRFISNQIVNIPDINCSFIVWKHQRIILKTIKKIVHLDIPGCVETSSYQFSPIVQPGGENGNLSVRVLFFKQSENGPILIIWIGDIIVPNVVFVHPGTRQQGIVTYSRYSRSFGVGAWLASDIGRQQCPLIGDVIQMGSFNFPQDILGDAIYDDKYGFSDGLGTLILAQ